MAMVMTVDHDRIANKQYHVFSNMNKSMWLKVPKVMKQNFAKHNYQIDDIDENVVP